MAAEALEALRPSQESQAFLESQTLQWKGRSIRVIQTTDGTPWFALPDLCDALGYEGPPADVVYGTSFPAWARCLVTEDPRDDGEGAPQDVVVLSPVGVWWWTHLTNAGRGQGWAAWAKREALRLNPTASTRNRQVFLTLLQGGELPPYPYKYSGRRSEWIDLKYSDAYLFRSDPYWAERCLRIAQRAAEESPAALEARKRHLAG